jgi:uncharacterized Ntn-hydrolase superfamily protein
MGTFSIIAISPNTKLIGIAVASGSTSVGNRVPHAKPAIGVIATQAYTNVTYGTEGLELLTRKFTPTEALNRLLMKDPEKELRQVAIMDFKKRKAIFSGAKIPKTHGEITAENYVIIGNLLANQNVLKNMAKEFENSNGEFAKRLTMALKAGSKSGGDKRGEKSAALIVVSNEKVETKIKVNVHENPIEELHRKLGILQQTG